MEHGARGVGYISREKIRYMCGERPREGVKQRYIMLCSSAMVRRVAGWATAAAAAAATSFRAFRLGKRL